MSASITDSIAPKDEVVLQWRVHLAKEEPTKLIVVIAITVITGLLSLIWFGGNIFPFIMIGSAFLGMLSDYLLPVTFTITTTHVSHHTLVSKRIMAWKDVKRVYLDDYGVKLSPLGRQTRLEAYRGVYLRFVDNEEEVLDAVKRLRPKNV